MSGDHEPSFGAPALMKADAPVSGIYVEKSCGAGDPATSTSRRRFSDEQIKSLQFMFESESRPEPRVMQQLADQLGLHPRQVAIWFQNRRARSKTKQMMRDYCTLKANYDTLVSDVESLKRENHLLHIQLQELKDALGRSHRA